MPKYHELRNSLEVGFIDKDYDTKYHKIILD